MHFLVVDARFGTPIYVFLESDPLGGADYPGLAVRKIVLEAAAEGVASRRSSIGRDPGRAGRFREFASDRAVTAAGFVLVEPRYIGATWEDYISNFRPQGDKPTKQRPSRTPPSPPAVGV
jgi:hypothetical protein